MIIIYPNKILSRPSEIITDFEEVAWDVGAELIRQRDKHKAAGIAAPQIGINKRVFAVADNFVRPNYMGKLQRNVICNPSWEPKDNMTYIDIEGCLSFPDIWIPVVRHNRIHVSYQDISGEHFEAELKGIEARVFQHEADHLDGKLFVSGLPEEFLKQITNRLKE